MKRLEEKQDCGEEQRLSAEQPHYLQRHAAKIRPGTPTRTSAPWTPTYRLPASANLM